MLTICTYDEKHVTYGENRGNNKKQITNYNTNIKKVFRHLYIISWDNEELNK
jgi:hypothetical protein